MAGTTAVTEVGVINSLYKGQELVCIEQQLDDQKSEIEQENIITHHTDVSVLATSELQTKQDDNGTPLFNFVHPEKGQLDLFWKYHLKQDISDPVLKKAIYRKDGSNQKWLTYNEKHNALFCLVCIAFSSTSDTNSSLFIRGMNDRRMFMSKSRNIRKPKRTVLVRKLFFFKKQQSKP